MRSRFSVRRFQSTLLYSTCALALISTVATLASAQEQQSQTSPSLQGLESLTVTARRIEENIQRVPIAITAFSSERVEKMQIVDVHGLAQKVPSLNMCCHQGNVDYGFLRGATGVAYYFNDAPINTQMASGFGNFFDVQNVQVLKGPQGTLFGTASNAGAVLYNPVKPGWEMEGYVSGTVGNYGRGVVEGAMTLPLIEDMFTARLSAKVEHRGGYYKVENQPGVRLEDRNYQVIRASTVIKPFEKLENYLTFNYYKYHNTPAGNGTVTSYLPSSDPNGLYSQIYGDAVLRDYLANETAAGRLFGYTVPGVNFIGNSDDHKWQLINKTSYEVTDNITLENIFSFYKYNRLDRYDFDTSPLALIHIGNIRSTWGSPKAGWSDEAKVQSTLFDKRLKLTTGAFFYGPGTGEKVNGLSMGDSLGFMPSSDSWVVDKNRGHAVYAQGTADLSELIDGLSVTAGYRYSWDTAKQINRRYPAIGYDKAGVYQVRATPDRVLVGQQDWKKGSYTISASYQVTPDTMLFLTNSQGSSAGGLALDAPPSLQSYGPASLNLIEGGVKSEFTVGGAPARFNVTGFHGNYKDIAVQVLRRIRIDPPPAPEVSSVVTENAATAIMYGVDYDITVAPTDWLELTANGAYNHFHFSKWDSLDVRTDGSLVVVDLSSTRIQYTPKFKYAFGFTLHLPTPETYGDLSLTGNWSHQGRVYVSLVPESTARRNIDGITNPPYGNLDLGVDLDDALGANGLGLNLYWTNVLGNKTTTGTNGGIFNFGVNQILAAEPPMFGVRATYKF